MSQPMNNITVSKISQFMYVTGEYYRYSPRIISYANGQTIVSPISPYSKYNDYIDNRFLFSIKREDIQLEIEDIAENEIILFKPYFFCFSPDEEKNMFIRYANYQYLNKDYRDDYPELFWEDNYTVYVDIAKASREIINILNDTEINQSNIANFQHYIDERQLAIENTWHEDYLKYFRHLLESKYNVDLSKIPDGFLSEIFFGYKTTVEWKNYGLRFTIDLHEIVSRMSADGHFNKSEIDNLLKWAEEDTNYKFMIDQYKQ